MQNWRKDPGDHSRCSLRMTSRTSSAGEEKMQILRLAALAQDDTSRREGDVSHFEFV